MTKRLFITGTNTDVGKTRIACGLLKKISQAGYTTAALKPVASGCEMTPQGLASDDALRLQKAATEKLAYEQVNPFVFEPAIAPHIAAQQVNQSIDLAVIQETCAPLLETSADVLLIEGAGGWFLPLNEKETLADWVKLINAEIVLVVGMTLGCLNHTLLTVKGIESMGLRLSGWIANEVDPNMECLEENIETLMAAIDAPCWGRVPHLADPEMDDVAMHLTPDKK